VAIVTAGDVRTPAAQARVEQVAAELRVQPDVATVASFYETHDPAMVSRGGRSTDVVAYFKPRSDTQLQDAAQRIEDHFAGQRDVRLGGEQIAAAQANTQVGKDLVHAELLAFPFIFLLSLLFFRSLVASLIPPLLGGLAILATFFALRIVSSFTDLSVFALNLVIGLGLGFAIDYSLFMVSRYREEAAVSGFGLNAIRRTLETSGRTILFSSLTVAAALASLAIFPQGFLSSMGIAGAIVALIAAALALIVLPALLTVLGPRVNALAPKRLQRAADRDARPEQSGFWCRLSRVVMRRPGPIAATSAAALIALGIPFASIKFLPVSASVLPASASAHQVDVALRTQFPPGRTAPLEVVVGARAASPQIRGLAARLDTLPDVAAVAPAIPAGPKLSMVAVAPGRASVQRPHAAAGALGASAARPVLCRRHRPDRQLRRPRAQPREPPAAGHRRGRAVDADRAVPDDRLRRATGEGGADERAQPERRVRNPGADLPARQPPRPTLLPAGRRARRDPADPAVRDRLRGSDRLRCIPAVADQGGARPRRVGL
jgi:RND superfamily putative drug exporter